MIVAQGQDAFAKSAYRVQSYTQQWQKDLRLVAAMILYFYFYYFFIPPHRVFTLNITSQLYTTVVFSEGYGPIRLFLWGSEGFSFIFYRKHGYIFTENIDIFFSGHTLVIFYLDPEYKNIKKT